MKFHRDVSSFRRWFLLVGLVALIVGIPLPPAANAANFNPGCTAGVGDTAALQTAITTANGNAQPDTITLVAGCTYTLSAGLSISTDSNLLTLNGNGATISGNNAVVVLIVSGGTNVVMNNVSIVNGRTAVGGAGIINGGTLTLNNATLSGNTVTSGDGGAIVNSFTLTVNNSTFTNNSASNFGGGIYNNGTLTVNNSTLTNNAALGTGLGGAIYNAANKTATISGSTLTNNTALQGAAIHNAAGTLRVDTSTFTHNIAAEFGGGIRSAGSTGNTNVNTSLFLNNEAGTNGGAYYNSVGIVTISNSTFTGNNAGNGGGVYVLSGFVDLINDTISGNTATGAGGGIVRAGNTVSLSRTLVAANNGSTSPDISGTINSLGYNLIGNTSGASGIHANDLTNAAATPLNLGALANNGGSTQTMALLPGSVAIDSGTPGYTSTEFDQRWIGYPRVVNGRVDIGAFEAQAACPSFPASIPNGNAAALINAIHCANRTPGAETINLAAGGSYSLTTFHYSSVSGSVNGLPAVNDAAKSGALTINGNGATLTRGSASEMRLLEVLSGGNLTLNAMILSNGRVSGFGGGIYNAGVLAINSSTLTGNQAPIGGGLYNRGTLTITGSSFTNNLANAYGGGLLNALGGTATISASTFNNNDATNGGGGGINNDGTLSVTTTTISNSDTTDNNTDGAGIRNMGTATISASTLKDNFAKRYGGGIYNEGGLTVTNTTISANFASNIGFVGRGGGIYTTGTATITHSTITNNVGGDLAGGIAGNVTLGNTIVAANIVSGGATDIFGTVTSLGYNLIGSSNGAFGLAATDLTDAAAQPLNLGGLANNGGPTETRALLAGSKAINRGNPGFSSPPDTDQRGTGSPRVRGGRIDIGAYESENYVVLNVQLTLQGRPGGVSPSKVTTNHVQVRPSAGGAPVFVGDYVSNTSGLFSILELVPGSYNIWIKGTHTLGRVHAITLVVGDNNLTTSLLLEGDADDSNSVALTDFSLLASSFGRASGDAGFDARADFNQDGVVNLPDFSLLASNFGQSGAP